MAPTISDTAYSILRALIARNRVVPTGELRAAIGFDPHPMLRRDIVGRGWALPWDTGPLQLRGVQISDLGRAAFELGRLERRDKIPELVTEVPVIATGMRRSEASPWMTQDS